jgi:hypothetical protein
MNRLSFITSAARTLLVLLLLVWLAPAGHT